MKQQYLASNRGRVHLLASFVLATAVGLAIGNASHPAVGALGGGACAAVLVVLGYAVFILEVRINSLVRGTVGQRRATRPASAATNGHAPVAAAGRGAARQVAGPNDERTLWRLTRDLPSQPVRLAAVAPRHLLERLPADEVVTMVPGYTTADLEAGSYRALLLDRAAFARGPWAGAESAVGVDLFHQLRELVAVARRRRIPVLVLDAPVVSDVGSSDLLDLGDLLLPLPPSQYPPEGASSSPFLRTLQQVGADRFRTTQPVGSRELTASAATAGDVHG